MSAYQFSRGTKYSGEYVRVEYDTGTAVFRSFYNYLLHDKPESRNNARFSPLEGIFYVVAGVEGGLFGLLGEHNKINCCVAHIFCA